MKIVKSLLLGSAAGLVAVTAGQAADLPVKAKPVEYVKICSLYGAGFYYMPGTDMCIKVGGWVRAEANWVSNQTGSLAWGPFNGDLLQRSTNNYQVRARGYVTVDAREQTAYGTARAYLDVGINTSDIGTSASEGTFSSNRAFLQWAGMTAGVTQSFYDFYSAAAALYRAGYLPSEDTGDGGWWVWAYTAQFGGGFSATLSAESRRENQIIDVGTVPAAGFVSSAGVAGVTAAHTGLLQGSLTTSTAGAGYGGYQVPDIVGNLRVDQAWGAAQIMAGAHELNPLYYGTTVTTGHPSDSWGWVAGAGLKLNAPMIAQGDYFDAEVNFTQGALKYLYSGEDSNMDNVQGTTQGWGVATDCVYNSLTSSSCEQTTGWSAVAAFEHYWTPQWHQSLTGGYMHVSYDATANATLCAAEAAGIVSKGVVTADGNVTAACSNDWSYWAVGSRLQWDITKSFYIGVEALYSQLDTATSGSGFVPAAVGLAAPATCGAAPGNCTEQNQSNWAFTVRMHKDFLP